MNETGAPRGQGHPGSSRAAFSAGGPRSAGAPGRGAEWDSLLDFNADPFAISMYHDAPASEAYLAVRATTRARAHDTCCAPARPADRRAGERDRGLRRLCARLALSFSHPALQPLRGAGASAMPRVGAPAAELTAWEDGGLDIHDMLFGHRCAGGSRKP